ncbi:hypothetical protein GTP81_29790, partial [Rugamonas sp. FT107W]|nr:hypothetical protein [Duganella vulcania]
IRTSITEEDLFQRGLVQRDVARFDVRCAAADKLAVLAALLPHARDIALHEPTLEQVFLGYGGAYASSH